MVPEKNECNDNRASPPSACLDTSIRRGPRAAMAFVVAICLSILIALCIAALHFNAEPAWKDWLWATAFFGTTLGLEFGLISAMLIRRTLQRRIRARTAFAMSALHAVGWTLVITTSGPNYNVLSGFIVMLSAAQLPIIMLTRFLFSPPAPPCRRIQGGR